MRSSNLNRTKIRISITIIPMVNDMLDKLCKTTGRSKSSLVENALKVYLEKKLEAEAKIISKMKFDDLPTEDEWLSIQSEIL